MFGSNSGQGVGSNRLDSNPDGAQVMALEDTDEEEHLDLDDYEIVDDEEQDHDLLDEVSDDEDDDFNNRNMSMQVVNNHSVNHNVVHNSQHLGVDMNRQMNASGVPVENVVNVIATENMAPGGNQRGPHESQLGQEPQRNPSGFYDQHSNNNNNVNEEDVTGAVDPANAQPNQNQVNGSRNVEEEQEEEPGLDGYVRNELIGRGAYGIVYRATQRSTGNTVAIKRIPFADSTTEGGVPCSVIREISLLRELDHVNVVRLLDVLQARPGGLYLVFEYVAHDLKTFMDQYQTSNDPAERRGLPVPMVKSFMTQMLSGVAFCHTYRVLHRDLKPHNLLISADGTQLKLADFGLARLSGLPNGPYTHEVVTLWYRAPELLLGTNRYSAAVDVWSVGCIFAEMATGTPLFPGRTDIDQLFKIFQRRGTPNPDIWPIVTRLPYYNAEFPQWPVHPITDFVSLEALGSTNAADLLTKILQYDPDQRIACRAALQHPYITTRE